MKILGFFFLNKTEESACLPNMTYYTSRKKKELMSITSIFSIIRKPFNMEATFFHHALLYLHAAYLFFLYK